MSDLSKLKALYQEKIIPHSKKPYHFEKRETASKTIKAYNPLCGDKFEIYLNLEDETIQSIYFHGFGCAISKASTSILAEKGEGMTMKEFTTFLSVFLENLASEESKDLKDVELNILNDLKHFNGRMDCVKLAWTALAEAL